MNATIRLAGDICICNVISKVVIQSRVLEIWHSSQFMYFHGQIEMHVDMHGVRGMKDAYVISIPHGATWRVGYYVIKLNVLSSCSSSITTSYSRRVHPSSDHRRIAFTSRHSLGTIKPNATVDSTETCDLEI